MVSGVPAAVRYSRKRVGARPLLFTSWRHACADAPDVEGAKWRTTIPGSTCCNALADAGRAPSAMARAPSSDSGCRDGDFMFPRIALNGDGRKNGRWNV